MPFPLPKIFALVGVFFGLLMVFLVPPFQSPDEMAHLARSYELSEGQLLSQKDCVHKLPQSFQTFFQNSSFFEVRDQNKDFNFKKTWQKNQGLKIAGEPTDYVGSSCPYPPFPYLSQIIAVIFGKILNLDLSIIFYLGRILNLFVYLFLLYLALKITPEFKKTLALVALTPIALQGASSWSADGFVIGLVFLFVAYVLRLAYRKEINDIGKKEVAVLFVLSFLFTLSKLVYLPVLFFFLLLPLKKFKTKKEYYLTFLSLLSLVTVLLLFWLYLTRNIQVSILSSKETFNSQLSYVLFHPFSFLLTVLKTAFIDNFYNYFIESFGVLGWYKVKPYFFVAFSYLTFVGIIASLEFNKLKKNEFLSKKKEYFFAGIAFGVFALTSLAIFFVNYLSFSSKEKIGGDAIIGIQGRYFLPILPFLFFSLPALRNLVRKKYFIYLLSLLSLLVSTYMIYKKYY